MEQIHFRGKIASTGFAMLFSVAALIAVMMGTAQSEALPTVLAQAAPAAPSHPAKTYTPQDVTGLLAMLHDAHRFVSNDAAAMEKKLHVLRTNWENQITDETPRVYAGKATALIREFQDFYVRLDDFMLRKYPYYRGELGVAMNMGAHPNNVVQTISAFAEGVNALPEKPDMKTIGILLDRFGPLDGSGSRLRAWIGSATDRIGRMTDNLRTSGTTGYEKD